VKGSCRQFFVTLTRKLEMPKSASKDRLEITTVHKMENKLPRISELPNRQHHPNHGPLKGVSPTHSLMSCPAMVVVECAGSTLSKRYIVVLGAVLKDVLVQQCRPLGLVASQSLITSKCVHHMASAAKQRTQQNCKA
jgi:hypothetical protein